MKSYLKILSLIENVILIFGMSVMTAITFINVVIRKFTTISFAFTEEISASLFILVALVGAAVAARRGANMGLTVITDLFSPKYRKCFVWLSAAICAVFCVFLVKYGFSMAYDEFLSKQTTSALGWPEWIFGSFVPIGALLLGLEFLNYAILYCIDSKKKEVK